MVGYSHIRDNWNKSSLSCLLSLPDNSYNDLAPSLAAMVGCRVELTRKNSASAKDLHQTITLLNILTRHYTTTAPHMSYKIKLYVLKKENNIYTKTTCKHIYRCKFTRSQNRSKT